MQGEWGSNEGKRDADLQFSGACDDATKNVGKQEQRRSSQCGARQHPAVIRPREGAYKVRNYQGNEPDWSGPSHRCTGEQRNQDDTHGPRDGYSDAKRICYVISQV